MLAIVRTTPLLLLLISSPAIAKLGQNLDQAEADYGLEKTQSLQPRPPALLTGANERTFEKGGWWIRCAFLPAKDGRQYIVREEYRKVFNGESMKQGGTVQFRDSELQEILEGEKGRSSWGDNPPEGYTWPKPKFPAGPIWYRADYATAWTTIARISLTLELRQARDWEAQLTGEQKLQLSPVVVRPSATISPETSSPPPLPNLPTPKPNLLTRKLAPGLPSMWVFAVLIGGIGALRMVVDGLSKSRRSPKNSPPPNPTVSPAVVSSLPLPAKKNPPPHPAPRSFQDLNWEEFELLVGEIYRRQGYTVHLARAAGADGGIDLTLFRDGQKILVQCKNWTSAKVTASEIREFFGVMVSESAARGIFVAAGEFTSDALDFSRGKPIEIVTGTILKELMRQVESGKDEDLLQIALWAPHFVKAAILIDPLCPFCRSAMVLRRGQQGAFWGCPTFPRCRGQRKTRQYLEPA